MDTFRIDSAVFVTTGYTDSQLLLEGYQGKVVGQQGKQYWVSDARGEVCLCDACELQPISAHLAQRLPASPLLHPPFME